MSLPLENKFVSSANNIGIVCLQMEHKSLLLIKNSKGPSIDPCGTPHLIVFVDDVIPLCHILFAIA